MTSALHQFDKAAAQFQTDQPWTKQANWVDFDLLGDEAVKQFSAFERLGQDHLMGSSRARRRPRRRPTVTVSAR